MVVKQFANPEAFEIKPVDKYRKKYGLFFMNNNVPIAWAEINYVGKIFEVFEMEIPDSNLHRKGCGGKFLNLLISELAKPKECDEIVVRWPILELIPILLKRGFVAINRTQDGVDFNRKL